MKLLYILLIGLLPFSGMPLNQGPIPLKKYAPRVFRQDSVVYRQRAIAFIKQVENVNQRTAEFILENEPASLKQMDCLQELMADHQTYAAVELKAIEAAANHKYSPWTSSEFPGFKLVESDTIRAIFKDYHKHWRYAHRHIGLSFNSFSMPIFIRHNSYCLFYRANHCGGLCGGGYLSLYKEQNGNWITVKSYCQWES